MFDEISVAGRANSKKTFRHERLYLQPLHCEILQLSSDVHWAVATYRTLLPYFLRSRRSESYAIPYATS